MLRPLTQDGTSDFIRKQFHFNLRGGLQMRTSLLNAVAAATLLLAASPAVAKGGTWVPVALQNASATQLFGINDSNTISGGYTDASGNVHGFIGDFAGDKYTSFDDPDSDTQARGMNDKNAVAGFDAGAFAPWEYSAKGKLTAVTKNGTDLDQLIQGINKAGTFTGDYTDTDTGLYVGYTGAKSKWKADFSLPKLKNGGYAGRAIDSAGDIAGWYYDTTTGLQRGYLLPAGAKKATLIDYPKAEYTVVEGMNDNGLVVGQWEDSSAVIHGFIYTVKTGAFTSLDAPGAGFTQVWNINNHNVITASTDVAGSFAYCMSKKGCPKGGMANIGTAKMAPARP
jgi:hypothetical protein